MEQKPRTPREIDAAIRRFASGRHWVVAAWELRDLGIHRPAVRARLANGTLSRIHAGVYAVGRPQISRHGELAAAVLALGPGALLSHDSGAALWRLCGQRAGAIHVTGPTKARPLRGGIAYHFSRCMQPEDRTEVEGIPVTAVPRTLLDVAATRPGSVRRLVEEADRLGILSVDEVTGLLARTRGHRGRRELRRHIDVTPAPTRSELEDRFLDLVREAGLPMPLVNTRVAGLEVDMLWSSDRFAVELDGAAYHRTAAQQARDRRREEALDRAGIGFRRFDWFQVTREPATVAAAIARRVRGSGRS